MEEQSNDLEYELKYLGSKESLETLLESLITSSIVTNLLKTHTYTFNTVYYDSACLLRDQGFALRFRGVNPEAGYNKSTVELKALEGFENGVSKRLEIGLNGDMSLTSYFNLLACKNCPEFLRRVKFFSLEPVFNITTERQEFLTALKFEGKVYEVEIVLDRVESWAYDAIGRKVQKIPEYYELEIELKETSNVQLLEYVGSKVIPTICEKEKLHDVVCSSSSKAKRVYTKMVI